MKNKRRTFCWANREKAMEALKKLYGRTTINGENISIYPDRKPRTEGIGQVDKDPLFDPRLPY